MILINGVEKPKLSDLNIDVSKDWGAHKIENLGTPDSGDDALSRGLVDIYSIDYGLKWQDLGVIGGGFVWRFAYLGNGIILLQEGSILLKRSTDYGLTWTNILVGLPNSISGIADLSNGIALVGDVAGRIARSMDYGYTWTNLGAVTGNQIFDILHLGNGIVIATSDDRHIYRSTDYGLNWADLGAVFVGPNIALGHAYLSNGIAIVSDDNGHVFRSTDYGLNWDDLGAVATGELNAMAYLGNGIALLGDEAGHVFRSTDFGATWADLGTILGSDWINDIAYLGNGVVIFGCDNGHIYRSADYGVTWADLGAISGGSVLGLAYLDNGIALMGDHVRHVYRSTSAFQLSNSNPNQFDAQLQFGCLGAITPNDTSYLAPSNGATQVNEIRVRVTRPGVLKNLFIKQRVASGGAGWTDIYTVRVNGVNKSITCTLDNATEGSDVTNEELVAAGDQVSIRLVSNNVGDTSADVVASLELV
ncbi:hypothetical protein ES703_60008 [subsurface metagenome]